VNLKKPGNREPGLARWPGLLIIQTPTSLPHDYAWTAHLPEEDFTYIKPALQINLEARFSIRVHFIL
jgi:hypothetical protein